MNKLINCLVLLALCCGISYGARCYDYTDKKCLYGDGTKTAIPVIKPNSDKITAVDELTKDEEDQLQAIIFEVTQMARNLALTDSIVVAAYNVSNYVPAMITDEQKNFWQQQILPMLKSTLINDAVGRRFLQNAFTMTSKLSITLTTGANLLLNHNGSKAAIETVKKNYADVAAEFDKTMADVQSFRETSLQDFNKTIDGILGILGKDAADFTKQRSEIENDLAMYLQKKDDALYNITEKQAELTKTTALLNATQAQMDLSQAEINQKAKLIASLNDLDNQCIQAIKNIPDTISVTESASHHRWFHHYTTCRTRQVMNPYKEADIDHYESIIKANLAVISQQTQEKNRQIEIENYLKQSVTNLTVSLNKTADELKILKDDLPTRVGEFDKQIQANVDKLKSLNDQESQTTAKFGLQKTTLIRCVENVKYFGEILSNGTNAYDPLQSVLNLTRTEVKMNMDLMAAQSATDEDVYVATTELIHQVKMINSIVVAQEQFFKPSDDYNKLNKSLAYQEIINSH